MASVVEIDDIYSVIGIRQALSSWITRVDVKSTGAYQTNNLESAFLRFQLSHFADEFDGTVENQTKEMRLI